MSLPLNLAPQHLDRFKKRASSHAFYAPRSFGPSLGKMAVMCYKCKGNLGYDDCQALFAIYSWYEWLYTQKFGKLMSSCSHLTWCRRCKRVSLAMLRITGWVSKGLRFCLANFPEKPRPCDLRASSQQQSFQKPVAILDSSWRIYTVYTSWLFATLLLAKGVPVRILLTFWCFLEDHIIQYSQSRPT